MLLEVLSYACLCVLVFVLKELFTTAMRNRTAHRFFEKHSPNLPVASNIGMFGGHINVIWGKKNWKVLTDLHKKHGKTLGLFYRDKPVVSTNDLDLLKALVLDKPNDHINRMTADSPVEELEKDSLFTSEDDQWRRIRRAVAPAFT